MKRDFLRFDLNLRHINLPLRLSLAAHGAAMLAVGLCADGLLCFGALILLAFSALIRYRLLNRMSRWNRLWVRPDGRVFLFRADDGTIDTVRLTAAQSGPRALCLSWQPENDDPPFRQLLWFWMSDADSFRRLKVWTDSQIRQERARAFKASAAEDGSR